MGTEERFGTLFGYYSFSSGSKPCFGVDDTWHGFSDVRIFSDWRHGDHSNECL